QARGIPDFLGLFDAVLLALCSCFPKLLEVLFWSCIRIQSYRSYALCVEKAWVPFIVKNDPHSSCQTQCWIRIAGPLGCAERNRGTGKRTHPPIFPVTRVPIVRPP